MKLRRWCGWFIGAIFGLVLLGMAVAISNETPDFGGILLVPFVVLVFVPLGAFVEWLLRLRLTLTLQTRADFPLLLRGLAVAVGICVLLMGLLAVVGRQPAAP